MAIGRRKKRGRRGNYKFTEKTQSKRGIIVMTDPWWLRCRQMTHLHGMGRVSADFFRRRIFILFPSRRMIIRANLPLLWHDSTWFGRPPNRHSRGVRCNPYYIMRLRIAVSLSDAISRKMWHESERNKKLKKGVDKGLVPCYNNTRRRENSKHWTKRRHRNLKTIQRRR